MGASKQITATDLIRIFRDRAAHRPMIGLQADHGRIDAFAADMIESLQAEVVALRAEIERTKR